MIDKIMISMFYILPIGGMSFALFKIWYNSICLLKSSQKERKRDKKITAKIIFSFLGGLLCSVSFIIFICLIWIPHIRIDLPIYFVIALVVPIAVLAIGMSVLVGLGKAVEAGAGSVTGTLYKLKGQEHKNEKRSKHRNKKWARRPESQTLIIEERLKKSSYSPTMPVGVAIISFIALYGLLGNEPNAKLYLSLIAALALVLTYLAQLFHGRSFVKSPSFKICNKCLKEDLIGSKKCYCGGTLEPPELYIFEEIEDHP